MDKQLASLTWLIDALAVLLASFAVGSLLIAAIGQYAAVAFTMRRRMRDFGVRIALGASSRDILTSVLREGLRLTAVGLAIGGALSLATAGSLRSMLFGVTPTDARTYVGVFALLATASLGFDLAGRVGERHLAWQATRSASVSLRKRAPYYLYA